MDEIQFQQIVNNLNVGEKAALRRGLVDLARQFRQASAELQARTGGDAHQAARARAV